MAYPQMTIYNGSAPSRILVKFVDAVNKCSVDEREMTSEQVEWLTCTKNVLIGGNGYSVIRSIYDITNNEIQVMLRKQKCVFIDAPAPHKSQQISENKLADEQKMRHIKDCASAAMFKTYITPPDSTLATIYDLINAESSLAAIKCVKDDCGIGLKEAKEFVDCFKEAMNFFAI